VILSVNLSEEELAALQRKAASEGRTLEGVARAAILEYAAGWSRERDRLIDAIVSEDAKALRRLGGG
jgi:hypothetical protein